MDLLFAVEPRSVDWSVATAPSVRVACVCVCLRVCACDGLYVQEHKTEKDAKEAVKQQHLSNAKYAINAARCVASPLIRFIFVALHPHFPWAKG